MAVKYTSIFYFQDPPKFTQIGIFWFENIYNLATLAVDNANSVTMNGTTCANDSYTKQHFEIMDRLGFLY
jgi:hypothetical protein